MGAKMQEMANLKLLGMDTLHMDHQQQIIHNMKMDDLMRRVQQQSKFPTQQSHRSSVTAQFSRGE